AGPLLRHHPDLIAQIQDARFDLALAGHTHGGQSRIPLVRQLTGRSDFDTYRRGLFQTPCGPLYVNPGIGTFLFKMRFLSRPEVTVIVL
ncbi:MAG: metallophosphoesterase, partial [Kiritimatiellia bacterium]